MAAGVGFKTADMNWDASDLRDKLAKFKEYCANFKQTILKEVGERTSLVHFIMNWQAMIRNIQQLDLGKFRRTSQNQRKFGSDLRNTWRQK